MSLRWLCVATVGLLGCEQPEHGASREIPLWTVDLQPQIILGGDEGSAPLYRVTGVARVAEGYFVVNAGAHELRVYNERGELIQRAGHAGSGPGEFRSPRLVGRLAADSLVIFDKPLDRTSIVCSGVQICDSWKSPASLGSVIGVRDDRVLFERIAANAMREGVSHDVHTFAIAKRGAPDPQFTVDLHGVSRMAMRVSGPLVSMPVPFTQPAHAALVSSGLILVDGPTGKIRSSTLAGSDSITIALAAPPVDPAQFRQAIDNLITEASPGRQPMLRSFYDAMSPPQNRSAVRGLLVDRVGLIWLNVDVTEPDDPQWLIVDSAGEIQALVRTPPALVIQEVGEDYVLGVWRDDLDVESVRVYRLRR
jgi:hypothetical protein